MSYERHALKDKSVKLLNKYQFEIGGKKNTGKFRRSQSLEEEKR